MNKFVATILAAVLATSAQAGRHDNGFSLELYAKFEKRIVREMGSNEAYTVPKHLTGGGSVRNFAYRGAGFGK